MNILVQGIAGGWYWCSHCSTNHMECSPCPKDPNFKPVDGKAFRERLSIAVDKIKESERLDKNMSFSETH